MIHKECPGLACLVYQTSTDRIQIMQGQPMKPDNVWYVNSGCSRRMTGNSALLHDFKNVNGGYVAFGSRGGRISGQGTVSNGTLNKL